MEKKNKNEGGGTSFFIGKGKYLKKLELINLLSLANLKKFRQKILGASKNGKYWASGISVVAHMKNPKIPAIHFNTRFIITTKEWFGGGMDATQSHEDMKKKNYYTICLKKYVHKIKRAIKNIRNGVINIFICLIEKKLEVLVEFF